MALVRCGISGGAKLPDSVTFNGTGHAGYHAGMSYAEGSGYATITIPTLGYKKADITASSSNVGTGKNCNISNIATITVKTNYSCDRKYHEAYNYYYGSGDGSYNVVLHN